MKHTPGPWKFLDDRAVVAGDVLIAQTSKINDSNYANANLIAAAPEMLEALEKLTIEFELQLKERGCNIESSRQFYRPLVEAIRVIAKARGES